MKLGLYNHSSNINCWVFSDLIDMISNAHHDIGTSWFSFAALAAFYHKLTVELSPNPVHFQEWKGAE